jgi:hypothetical protein
MVFGLGILGSHSGNHIPYTLPDELSHHVRVHVNVILIGNPEHIPVRVIKTRGLGHVEAWISIVQTSVE